MYHACSQGSALDEEARARGTSVYLVQRVIPMLPRLLCEKLCSLNSGGAVLRCCAGLGCAVLGCAVTIWLACWTAAGIPTNIFMSHCLPAMSTTACAFCKQGGNTAAASIACYCSCSNCLCKLADAERVSCVHCCCRCTATAAITLSSQHDLSLLS